MLPQIKAILFATDPSDNANDALPQAVALGESLNAQVNVVHVTEPLSPDAIKDRRSSIKDLLKANQQAFVASLSEEDMTAYANVASVELVEGHSAEDILRLAAELKCDLTVKGAHDHGSGHTFLETVAKRVLRRT